MKNARQKQLQASGFGPDKCLEPGARVGTPVAPGRRMRPVFLIIVTLLARSAAAAQTPPPPPPPVWDVQIGASFVGTGGNSDTSSAGADFGLHRRWLVWQIESAASAVRTSSQDVRTAERYLGAFRGQRKLTSLIGLSSGIKLE